MSRFPQIPFIPPEPYDVIRTDYETYALVQGANDTSFVQIYSRTPNPGKAFIQKQKDFLRQYGYAVDDIRETPQASASPFTILQKSISHRTARSFRWMRLRR